MTTEDPKVIDSLVRSRIKHASEYYDQLKYEVDPLGGYRICRNQQLPHIRINDQGYRGRNFAGSESVLLLGDSVTFGVGASSDECCFARFLEREMGRPVADGSVRAYRTCQHFTQLPRLFSLLPNTRLVILWMGYADLLFWTTTGGCVEGAFQFERKYRAQSLRTSLMSKIAVTATTRFSSPGSENRACEKGTIDDLARHVALYAGAIGSLCRSRNTDLRIFIQPFIRRRPVDLELRRITDFYSEKTETKCGVNWYELTDRYVLALVRELGVVESTDRIDLQPYFADTDFLDQVHLREESLQAAASLVAKLAMKETAV